MLQRMSTVSITLQLMHNVRRQCMSSRFLLVPMLLLTGACATASEIEAARSRLSTAGLFTSAHVGVGGDRSPDADALQLLTRRSNSEAHFLELAQSPVGPPSLYGLCGLHLVNSSSYDDAKSRISASRVPIRTMQGCVVLSYYTATEIVSGTWGVPFTDRCEALVQ